MTLPCIICGKELEPAIPARVSTQNQPNDGTVFSSRGNYGSTVWDPMTGVDLLEINVCDPCLVKHKDRVVHITRVTQDHDTTRPWEPEEVVN